MNRVGGRIICIGEVDFQTEVVGEYIALQVDVLEVTPQTALARGVAADVAGECFHVGLHEGHIGVVDLEADVERVVEREDGAVDEGLAAVRLVDYGVEGNGARLALPVAAHQGVAEHYLVVAYAAHAQTGCLQYGFGGEQARGVECAGGVASELHLVDAEALEKIVEVEVAQIEREQRRGVVADGAVDAHELVGAVHVDTVDRDVLRSAQRYFRRSHAPCGVVERKAAWEYVDFRAERRVGGVLTPEVGEGRQVAVVGFLAGYLPGYVGV